MIVQIRSDLEDIAGVVATGMAEGKSLDELKKTIAPDKYSVWPNFAAARPNHIEAAFTNLRDYR